MPSEISVKTSKVKKKDKPKWTKWFWVDDYSRHAQFKLLPYGEPFEYDPKHVFHVWSHNYTKKMRRLN